MNNHSPATVNRARNTAGLIAFLFVLGLSNNASAQHRVSRNFPAGKNVRIEVKNLSGTITVETWPRDEIKITAILDTPKANYNPRQTEFGLVIDMEADNRGRGDVQADVKRATAPVGVPEQRPHKPVLGPRRQLELELDVAVDAFHQPQQLVRSIETEGIIRSIATALPGLPNGGTA